MSLNLDITAKSKGSTNAASMAIRFAFLARLLAVPLF